MINRLEEYRQTPRVKIQDEVRYQIRGKPIYSHTVSDNISLGGMSFTNGSFLSPDTLLMLEVNVLSRVLKPVAKVRWTNSVAHTDRYKYGVEFLEMDNEDKKYLSEYIDMQNGLL
jgi:c-di-GMP-binding flagellar brake protein YcgR